MWPTARARVRNLCPLKIEVARRWALAVLCLAGCGGNPTDQFAEQLHDADARVRLAAIHALGRRGAAATVHLPALESALEDPLGEVRLAAALAMLAIDPLHETPRPVLTEALLAGRHEVFLRIGSLGSEGAWAVPPLVEQLSHRHMRIRALAALTLGQLGQAASEATDALRKLEADPEPNVRKMAKQALERIFSEP